MVSLFQMHFEFHHSDTIRKVSLSKIMFIIITDINSLSYCSQTGTEDQRDLRNHTNVYNTSIFWLQVLGAILCLGNIEICQGVSDEPLSINSEYELCTF